MSAKKTRKWWQRIPECLRPSRTAFNFEDLDWDATVWDVPVLDAHDKRRIKYAWLVLHDGRMSQRDIADEFSDILVTRYPKFIPFFMERKEVGPTFSSDDEEEDNQNANHDVLRKENKKKKRRVKRSSKWSEMSHKYSEGDSSVLSFMNMEASCAFTFSQDQVVRTDPCSVEGGAACHKVGGDWGNDRGKDWGKDWGKDSGKDITGTSDHNRNSNKSEDCIKASRKTSNTSETSKKSKVSFQSEVKADNGDTVVEVKERDENREMKEEYVSHAMKIWEGFDRFVKLIDDQHTFMRLGYEMRQFHSKYRGIGKPHYRIILRCVEETLLKTMDPKLYRKRIRESMIKFLELIYYNVTFQMSNEPLDNAYS